MKIDKLDLSKYKRFFAFGCSFTNYDWPTWADIIGKEVPYYENWAEMAGGNHFIFNSIIECDAKNKFQKDDLVIVMWTSIEREDRYNKGKWNFVTPASRLKTYGHHWEKTFGDEQRGLLIRDLAYIRAVQQLLKNRDCDWANFTTIPISRIDRTLVTDQDKETAHLRYVNLFEDLIDGKECNDPIALAPDVLQLYKEEFTNIKSSVLSIIFNGIWPESNRPQHNNKHPTPLEHYKYLKTIFPEFSASTDTENFINDWESKVWKLNTDLNNYKIKKDRL